LTSAINDLRKTTISNDSVHNGVQVGDSFGIRVARSDSKVITTLNATEGIKIQSDNKDKFFADINGVVTLDGRLLIKNGDAVLFEGYMDEYGGKLTIRDVNGYHNAKIGSESGLGDNIAGTLVLYDDAPDGVQDYFRRFEAGISKSEHAGIINLRDSSNLIKLCMYAASTLGPGFFVLYDNERARSYITATSGAIDGQAIATQAWVLAQAFANQNQLTLLESRISALESAG
jgi:hypothetical protein